MENKYFIPEISDFHNGYEYERNDGGEWYSVTCDLYDARDIKTLLNKKVLDTFPEGKSPLDSDTYSVHHKATDIDRIRVPHLTKEQIEVEGWMFVKQQNDYNIEFSKTIDDANYTLYYFEEYSSKNRVISILANHPTNIKPTVLVRNILCRDVNTFRKIIKLLGI